MRPSGWATAPTSRHEPSRAVASRIILLVLPDWPLDFSMRRNLDEASLALDEAGYALITMTPHPAGHSPPLWETLRPDVVMWMTPFAPARRSRSAPPA